MNIQPDLFSELTPNNDPFANITSVGTSLDQYRPQRVAEALATGDYVVGVATYKNRASSTLTIGHCSDLKLKPRDNGKYEANADWGHVVVMAGAEETSPGHFSAGGERTPLADTWNHGLPDGNLITGGNPTTQTSAIRSILQPTRAHGPAQTGPMKGFASLKTTQIVTAEQLPQLLRAVAETMGLEPQAADEYVQEASWYVSELDQAKALREAEALQAEALQALSALATVAAVEMPITQPKPTAGATFAAGIRKFRIKLALAHQIPLNL